MTETGGDDVALANARKHIIKQIRRKAHAERKKLAAERRAEREANRMRIENFVEPFRRMARDRLAELPQRNLVAAVDPETEALARIGRSFEMDRREARRVRAILVNDDIDRRRGIRRAEARIELMDGKYASLEDAKDGPTAEQLAAGDFAPAEVETPDDTVRKSYTVRRMPRLVRLWRAGVIDDAELKACTWYRSRWERSGLDPLIASTFEPKFGTGDRMFGHMAKTAAQAEARDDFRWARTFVPDDVRKLFDLVVIDDMAIRIAARMVRCRYANGTAAFRRGALGLLGGVGAVIRLDQKIVP